MSSSGSDNEGGAITLSTPTKLASQNSQPYSGTFGTTPIRDFAGGEDNGFLLTRIPPLSLLAQEIDFNGTDTDAGAGTGADTDTDTSTSTNTEASSGTGSDASVDTSTDDMVHTSTYISTDISIDTGTNTSTDASIEASTDTDTDTDTDTSTDTSVNTSTDTSSNAEEEIIRKQTHERDGSAKEPTGLEVVPASKQDTSLAFTNAPQVQNRQQDSVGTNSPTKKNFSRLSIEALTGLPSPVGVQSAILEPKAEASTKNDVKKTGEDHPTPKKAKREGAALLPVAQKSLPAAPAPRQYRCKPTGYVYDLRMLLHSDHSDVEGHPECPERILRIHQRLQQTGLLSAAKMIPVNITALKERVRICEHLLSVHSSEHFKYIEKTSREMSFEELQVLAARHDSIYLNPDTFLSSFVAMASTLLLCEAIARGDLLNGFAIVRPPGHHAEHDRPMGFCFYNNVAVAASALRRQKLAQRIMIVDWDIHHGNGTQNIFADNPDVLYVSLHRYDSGHFYPQLSIANHDYVGVGKGLGKSVNVAWNGGGFGDGDYMYAFNRLIMPIAHEFAPDFVIVSAGFDSAAGDPIGECSVTPLGYSLMLRQLMTLAGGRVALVLEGGYNLDAITDSYEVCVRTLLQEAPPPISAPLVPSMRAVQAVENSVLSLSPHWKCLFPKSPSTGDNLLGLLSTVPMAQVLDCFWAEEVCKRRLGMQSLRPLFAKASPSLAVEYGDRLLAHPSIHYDPEVIVLMLHEAGSVIKSPTHSQASLHMDYQHLSASLPFLRLIEGLKEDGQCCVVNLTVPACQWRLKQTTAGDDAGVHKLKSLLLLLWDGLLSRRPSSKICIVAQGLPIYAVGHLINSRQVESSVKSVHLFSSTFFLPMIIPEKQAWFMSQSHVVIPARVPAKSVIEKTDPAFGKCLSAGCAPIPDIRVVVSDFTDDILQNISSLTEA